MATYDGTLFDNPEFEHHEETSNIQLFFDLFFVANLTSFTNAHEINSIPGSLSYLNEDSGQTFANPTQKALSSYIGFFTVLWITWVQVTLYDVRFATDSVFERLAHACHFGVMVGLAVIGPQFNDPNADPVPWAVMQQLSLILMASRVVLICQYGTTLFFVWRYRDSRKPIAAVVITLSVAVILYLGVSFSFYNETAHNAYIAWYVIGVVEVASNLFIAKFNDSISFQNTHLIERMTCLTLIIVSQPSI
jgi:low temperature requirement protein LtrA